ncbi:hypothetical protein MMC07_005868 [Pseudocyphellaria aurata]|nr:hypothetical protein [Pseudocyphellaria aurata]
MTWVERQRQLRQTRQELVRREEANAQGAEANAAQGDTHGGVFRPQAESLPMGASRGVIHPPAESSAMGEHRGDFGSAFRPDFNGSFSHTGPGGELVSGSYTSANQENPSSGITHHPHSFPPQPTLYGTPDSTAFPVGSPYAHELLGMAEWADGDMNDLGSIFHTGPSGELVSGLDETTARANQENPSSGITPHPHTFPPQPIFSGTPLPNRPGYQMISSSDAICLPPTPHYAVPPDSTALPVEPQYSHELLQMVEWSNGILGTRDDLGSSSHTGQLVSGSDERIGNPRANQETSSSGIIHHPHTFPPQPTLSNTPVPTRPENQINTFSDTFRLPRHVVSSGSTVLPVEPQYAYELPQMADWSDGMLWNMINLASCSHTGPSGELVRGSYTRANQETSSLGITDYPHNLPPQPILSDTPLPTRPEYQMIPYSDTSSPPRHAVSSGSTVLPVEPQYAHELPQMADWSDGMLWNMNNLGSFSHTGPSGELVSGSYTRANQETSSLGITDYPHNLPPQPILSDTPLPTRPEYQMIPYSDTSSPPRHAIPPDSPALPAEPQYADELPQMADWPDGMLRNVDDLSSFSHTGQLVSGSNETIGDSRANQGSPSSGITPHPHTFPSQPTLSNTPVPTRPEDPSTASQHADELRGTADWADGILREMDNS